jgi:selenide, water dikinase
MTDILEPDALTGMPPTEPECRLTALAHGGGCGCKLSPAVLRQILAEGSVLDVFPDLLVGPELADDAAVWQLDQETCVVATTDFFMPIVDDPYDFGRIAAANAMSDIYAMGASPLFALAILGMPLAKLSVRQVREIVRGGAAVCRSAGVPVAGGHSIDAPEPIYGLVAVGTCHPQHVKRNADAAAGDALILTKPIGVGIYSAAFKKGALSARAYQEMIASATSLNRIGSELARHPAVHAMTDVTGFGLLGHALELARGSRVRAVINYESIPFLADAPRLAEQGFVTGASERNWTSYAREVKLNSIIPDWKRRLLTDPQTSGGLLISCAAETAPTLIEIIRAAGHSTAAAIGRVERAGSGVSVIARGSPF